MIQIANTSEVLGRLLLAQAELTQGGTGDFWFPPQASTHAADVDWTYNFILWVSYTFFALIIALMFYFMVKYRRREEFDPGKSSDHNMPLEITWTIIPLVLVAAMFIFGFRGYMDQRTPPRQAYTVYVNAQQWSWTFIYPNGHVDNKLHAPVNTPIKLVMSSDDVLHSLFIPAFRVKMDVVPGRYTEMWFEAKTAGVYTIYCTEFCGTKHSDMLSEAIIHPPGEFETWLAKASDIFAGKSMSEVGEMLYRTRGCAQCHSIDGVRGIGPSFKGLFGTTHGITGGEPVTVDENYVRESIMEPQAKIAEGYAPVMPTFQGKLDDKQITAIIEYMKTLR